MTEYYYCIDELKKNLKDMYSFYCILDYKDPIAIPFIVDIAARDYVVYHDGFLKKWPINLFLFTKENDPICSRIVQKDFKPEPEAFYFLKKAITEHFSPTKKNRENNEKA